MKKILNSTILKLIAIIAMTFDHSASLIWGFNSHNPWAIAFHVIGRLTFPIMAYLIVEGYHHTRNAKKYALRLFIFALISHVPYMFRSNDFATYGWQCFIPFTTRTGIGRFINQTSVMWSYLMGLLMLIVRDSEKIKAKWVKYLLMGLLCLLALPGNWSSVAALVILLIDTFKNKPWLQAITSYLCVCVYAVLYLLFVDKVMGIIQFATILAIPLIAMYNGKLSKNKTVNKLMKWFFYIYYPLHMAILGLIGIM